MTGSQIRIEHAQIDKRICVAKNLDARRYLCYRAIYSVPMVTHHFGRMHARAIYSLVSTASSESAEREKGAL